MLRPIELMLPLMRLELSKAYSFSWAFIGCLIGHPYRSASHTRSHESHEILGDMVRLTIGSLKVVVVHIAKSKK